MADVRNIDKEIAVVCAEQFRGDVVWDGIVKVFELHGLPKATHAYAWTHETNDPKQPKRSVPPAVFPETTVKVAIMQELRDAETA